MDALLLALALLTLWKCRPVKPVSGFYGDYLGLTSCRSLRGILAVLVIMHHIAQRTAAGLLFHRFVFLGNLPVAVFFFLSGYGLMKRYTEDGDYAKGFLLRRLPPLIAAFLFVLLCFKLIYALGGDVLSLGTLMEMVIMGDLTLCILWYVVVIVIFYIAFGVMMLVFRRRPGAVLVGMLAFCAAYTAILSYLGLGQWLYNTCHLLVIGMAWELYEGRALAFVKRAYWPLLISAGLLFLLLFQGFDRIFALCPTQGMRLAIALGRNFLSTLVIVLLLLKLKLGNPWLDYLGGISLELYVLQLIPLFLLRSQWLWVESDLLYAAAVLGCTVLLAAALGPPYQRLTKSYQKAIRA